MPRDADAILLVADILASDTSNGEVRCKLGEATTGHGKSADVAMYCAHGFIGVPEAPDADGSACQAFYAQDGDEQKIVGTRDNRLAAQVGQLDPGDRAIISTGDARVLVKRKGSSATLLTKNAKTNKTMMVIADGEHGEAKIQNGGAFVLVKDDKIVLAVNGGGAITIGKAGVQVTGGSFQATTGAVQLGDQGGGIAPPPSPASAVAVGPQPGAVSTKVFAAV
jgi:hypothetical protein